MSTAKLRHRSTSLPLQRVVVDFAADVPFAQAMDKLIEHYGVLLSETVIRRITQQHGRRMQAADKRDRPRPQPGGVDVVVAEMDGSLVPIVTPDETQSDRRRGKRLSWKEAKISLAHQQGHLKMHYGGTLKGGVDEAGARWFDGACRAGFGPDSEVHAVGDGAPWIVDQVEQRFGSQGRYLIDFYHVCEYLSEASGAIAVGSEAAKAWREQQQERLKQGDVNRVLEALKPHVEADDRDEASAPVRRCYRYLSNRRDQLDYPRALENGLPIGSGKIESAHRYVVQQRLKRAGAWWRVDNAEAMLALRCHRANKQWNCYWQSQRDQLAA